MPEDGDEKDLKYISNADQLVISQIIDDVCDILDRRWNGKV